MCLVICIFKLAWAHEYFFRALGYTPMLLYLLLWRIFFFFFLPFRLEKLKDSPPGPRQQRCWPPGERAAALCSQSCMLALETLKEKEQRQSRLCCLSPFLYKKDYHLSITYHFHLSPGRNTGPPSTHSAPSGQPGGPCATSPCSQRLSGALDEHPLPSPTPTPTLTAPHRALYWSSTEMSHFREPFPGNPTYSCLAPASVPSVPTDHQSPITNHRSPNHCFPRRIRCYLKYSNCLLPPSPTRM